MKRLSFIFLAALLVTVLWVLIRTFTFQSSLQFPVLSPVSVRANPQTLQSALKFETISHKPGMIDHAAFSGLHHFIDSAFPFIDSLLVREVVGQYSLVYTWRGQNSSLDPAVLMAHQDVVPVGRPNREDWVEPPFSGSVNQGHIYGRGTLDDKGSLIAILNAVEQLLQKGFQPERTIILSFGHDEEIGGANGAEQISKMLEKRYTKAWLVLDEGGIISEGIIPGLKKPAALIGTAEKGYMSLEFTAEVEGGHSSMPESDNAVALLNRALAELDKNPHDAKLTDPLEGFVENVGPHLPFTSKMAFANQRLFKPLIFQQYKKSPSGNALVRTTQVPTILNAGIKDNVIPTRATAVVNYRLLPGDAPDEVLNRARALVEPFKVNVRVHENLAIAASPVSDYRSPPFQLVGSAVKSQFPKAVVSPYLVLAATDARHFSGWCDHVYRFSPMVLNSADLSRIHGLNERLSIENFEKAVNFYATLIHNL